MEIKYVFTQKRREFGSPCHFTDIGPNLLVDIKTDPDLLSNYVYMPKADQGILCRSEMSRHEVNTVTQPTESRGINHEEGGWPADVDHRDEDQVARFKKKIEKDEGYIATVRNLADLVEKVVMENNAIDIYEEYFEGEQLENEEEYEHLKTLNLYRDYCEMPRSVSDVSWSADAKKIAASYIPRQYMTSAEQDTVNLDSYVWDVEDPAEPCCVLKPDIPLICLAFSHMNMDVLAGGYNNGQVAVWDIRKGNSPMLLSPVTRSHLSSVNSIRWIHSKCATEFISASTDGQVISWDTRNFSEPTETMRFDPSESGCSVLIDRPHSLTCLDYDISVPYRFMVGTDEGLIINCNRRFKEPNEKIVALYDTRSGPILSLERNPFLPKLFVAATAFCNMLWSEDNPQSSLIRLSTGIGYITDATWCRTRPSILFVAKTTGLIETWDILLKHREPITSIKLESEALTCIRPLEMGGKMTCGSYSGCLYLLQMPKSYGSVTKKEKLLVASIIDRETKREQLLLPASREERLREEAAANEALEAEKLKEKAIPSSWAPEDIGEKAYEEMNKLEFDSGFLDKKQLEEEAEMVARSLNIEEETGEARFLDALEREVQANELLQKTLVHVVTEVEADNTRFPYREYYVEEEFGEQEFLEDLERAGTSTKVMDKLLDEISDSQNSNET